VFVSWRGLSSSVFFFQHPSPILFLKKAQPPGFAIVSHRAVSRAKRRSSSKKLFVGRLGVRARESSFFQTSNSNLQCCFFSSSACLLPIIISLASTYIFSNYFKRPHKLNTEYNDCNHRRVSLPASSSRCRIRRLASGRRRPSRTSFVTRRR